MKTKEEYLWEEVKELALTKFCCESPGSSMVGTDGETFFYEPKFFLQLYMEKGIKGINRFFFHTLFHLLYGQVKGNIETSFLWNLAYDMVVEYTIDALGQEELIGKMSKPAREFCNQIWETGEGLSVEK